MLFFIPHYECFKHAISPEMFVINVGAHPKFLLFFLIADVLKQLECLNPTSFYNLV